MRLNSNMPSLRATANISRADRRVQLAMQKLSSGIRINSVADDPSGLAIVNRIKNQLRGMNMASKNSLDGISLAQTADGALGEIQQITQRIRELALQSANGTLTSSDREKIQGEVDELIKELDSLRNKTEFNNSKVLSGSSGRMGFSTVGGSKASYIAETVYISPSMPPSNFSYDILSFGTPATINGTISSSAAYTDSEFMINGETVSIQAGDSSDTVLEKMRAAAAVSDIDIFTPGYPPAGQLVLISKQTGTSAFIDIQPPSNPVLSALGLPAGKSSGTDAELANTAVYDENGEVNTALSSGKTVSINGNRVEVTGNNNQKIVFELSVNVLPDGSMAMKNGTEVSSGGIPSSGPINGMNLEISSFGPMIIQSGANKGMEMSLSIPNMSSKALGIENLNLKNQKGAEAAISVCDKALNTISAVRATLGAFENRLEHTISGLDASIYATEISRSRIEDTDMAQEMTSYTQLNILMQAGLSILAQANQRPQQLLQLIGG